VGGCVVFAGRLGHVDNSLTPLQCIGNPVDKISRPGILIGRRMSMSASKTLEGTGALVTGGSRGLGRALGQALAAAGARVVLVAREAGALNEAVAEIRGRGGEAYAVTADVGDAGTAHAVAAQAAALVGPVDLLVNNASTLGPVPLCLLLDTDCEDLERALAVNLVGPFRLTKAVAGPMVLRGRGTIVNVTSDAATEAYPRWGAYGASKAALEQLTRIWAAELEGTGLRAFSIDPGEMDTRMHADAIPDADRSQLRDPARVAARIVEMLADGTAAPPGARVALRLESEAA
jgi:NAD(P)-dependent dehydrogenase (short-subunit alcohol dehydrogenase family)